jgi:hypothetical protein
MKTRLSLRHNEPGAPPLRLQECFLNALNRTFRFSHVSRTPSVKSNLIQVYSQVLRKYKDQGDVVHRVQLLSLARPLEADSSTRRAQRGTTFFFIAVERGNENQESIPFLVEI